MLDPKQFLLYVIRPTQSRLGLWSRSAEVIELGTGLVESGLVYLRQLGGGPGRGPFQCEPATHHDIWQNWLADREPYESRVLGLVGGTGEPSPELLVTNLAYAAAICRIHYYRVPQALPAPDDAAGMAAYHKRFYNTALGATDPAESVKHFATAIAVASAS